MSQARLVWIMDTRLVFADRKENNSIKQITTSTSIVDFVIAIGDFINSLCIDLSTDKGFENYEIVIIDMLRKQLAIEYKKHSINPPQVPGMPSNMTAREYVDATLGKQATVLDDVLNKVLPEDILEYAKQTIMDNSKSITYEKLSMLFDIAIKK